MNPLLRWLLTALVSALAGAAAHWFEGSCPLDASSWVCGHWDLAVAVATFVLGALGVKVNRRRLATAKAAQRIASPVPVVTTTSTVTGEVVYVEPARWGENVAQNPDPSSSDTGGG